MRIHSLLIASTIATVLALPAMAQQSSTPHRYLGLFKYSDQAMKAMRENPQDRSAAAAKLYESLGGKLEATYFFPLGGEYDGMLIAQMPNDAAFTALNFIIAPTENFSKALVLPLMTADRVQGGNEEGKGHNHHLYATDCHQTVIGSVIRGRNHHENAIRFSCGRTALPGGRAAGEQCAWPTEAAGFLQASY
jgi:uncharacterized protein with GYD domain